MLYIDFGVWFSTNVGNVPNGLDSCEMLRLWSKERQVSSTRGTPTCYHLSGLFNALPGLWCFKSSDTSANDHFLSCFSAALFLLRYCSCSS
jgi:hypothetical protein